ncbi:MAG: hypothetical protein K8S18_13370 [Desulfobacula sp.]|nr:hypothetical protein [Desulfobacula sp.]
MPKISIKTLPLNKAVDIPQVLKNLGNKLSKVLDISLNRLVILWEQIPANQFLFNGQVTGTQKKSSHHPIVEVTAVEGMPRNLEKKMVHTIARTLSHELAIDLNNICVVLNTLAPGKLFVSGKFIKGSAKIESKGIV